MTAQTIAALVYDLETNPTPVLVEVAARLRARGVPLVGALQHDLGPKETCGMELEVLPSGTRLPMSQDLGPGSNACRLDPAAMAEASALVSQAIDAGAELALFNKFGAQEVAGEGLRDEMVAAVMAGIPMLTTVAERFVGEWTEFTGGETTLLACTVEDAIAWWDRLER
ncbi:DUF2478 domain-containing protein [Nitrogeniibacter mangrovi]|uniref:DUF2478 domain-containing protein n=1 Tax=Nitrogeniibacter mangrovi TaxID=2016596 RepID=A0A6C1B022_9RHOO|nr:DUF2478 domain-containing protein [Nitrogeniibacter mangrovi]QID16917.1 DUF2478 domain-containing protein [Nitrogeniibacter mangrovi]